jgi:tetratricopeptide (TPR) repeat protein
VELTGLEPRRSDLARGIVIARSARALDHATQRALWDALGEAGVTESDDNGAAPEEAGDDSDPPEPPRRWHAAPWLPPNPNELDTQRAAFERVAAAYELEAIWCIKVETGIDGVAWLELAAEERAEEAAAAEAVEPGEPGEVVDAIFDDNAEVLYAAPDAPAPDDEDPDDDEEPTAVEPDVSVEIEPLIESHWRNGTPPFEHTVPFPIQRYPEIIEDYDWESFGIALKLAGERGEGEESVINAFFALWLSVYQDERADEFEAFQRADVVHDRKHASALLWVDRFAVPATASDQVHFLLWIAARIHDILPIAWARFERVDDAVKARASGDTTGEPFVLAGNPFSDRFRRYGEESSLQWAVSQSGWSKRELAGMLVEVALEHDPDDPTTAAVAERLLRRALSFDHQSDATGYLAIVLVRQRRIADALALARGADGTDVRLLVVGEAAEHAPGDLATALELLDGDTLVMTDAEELADLVGTIARHAPQHLPAVLDKLPADGALVPFLYNASFAVERPQALAILRKVLALPEPPHDAGEARTAFVMAWNNACIHAHALGDYRLAVELADGGQQFAPENPYIYHSAACAYAAVGHVDRALQQVAQAIDHDYEHTEKMETDTDLALLQRDPRFPALFVEWRTRRADLN